MGGFSFPQYRSPACRIDRHRDDSVRRSDPSGQACVASIPAGAVIALDRAVQKRLDPFADPLAQSRDRSAADAGHASAWKSAWTARVLLPGSDPSWVTR